MSENQATEFNYDRKVIRLRLGVVNADLAIISYEAGLERAATICDAVANEMDNIGLSAADYADTYRKIATQIRMEKLAHD